MGNNRGFTLVEIAIVLFIAGVVLTAVLKGDSVLRGSKIQDIVTGAQDLSVAINNFKQRYHMLPGDFPMNQTTPEIGGITNMPLCWTGAYKGDGNGRIDNGANATGSFGVPAEAQCVPEVLFQAGLVNNVGKINDSNGVSWSVFLTKFGGRFWATNISSSNVANAIAAAGNRPSFPVTVTHVIEFEGLPCLVALDVDRQMDDGNLDSGRGRATVPDCFNREESLVYYAIAL